MALAQPGAPFWWRLSPVPSVGMAGHQIVPSTRAGEQMVDAAGRVDELKFLNLILDFINFRPNLYKV
jgi:hypothetical protein